MLDELQRYRTSAIAVALVKHTPVPALEVEASCLAVALETQRPATTFAPSDSEQQVRRSLAPLAALFVASETFLNGFENFGGDERLVRTFEDGPMFRVDFL
jgi:hypothetical protein